VNFYAGPVTVPGFGGWRRLELRCENLFEHVHWEDTTDPGRGADRIAWSSTVELQKKRVRARSGRHSKSTSVRKSIVPNSRSMAGGPHRRAEFSR
jgi:hypothetical protein